ncbi:hypothetical protein ACFUCV_01260 [Specibacter sp. NPDC057265]|uniref:hypothetical protein n=1 Tax=Specibacter sp. NPDC057265 TaxID=3346075 RepID=UPI00363E0A6C
MLEILLLFVLLFLCLAIPFALLQIPRLKASLAAKHASHEQRPRTWMRRLMGAGAMAASPIYGFAFPLAAIPAAAAVFVKPLAGWPVRTKALIGWSLAGILALVFSALYQGQEISGNILHYAAMALFVCAAVRLTAGEASAAQLLGYASIGSALFFVVFRPKNTDTFEHMWKYGLGPYVAIAAVWLACSLTERRLLAMLALLAVGSASLFLGFRSHGLVCFVTVVLLMFQSKTRKGKLPLVRIVAAGGALLGLYKLLPAAVAAGVFGEAVRLRTLNQLDDSGPALLAGRVEPPLSIAAIMEKPWFGWGNLNGIDLDTLGVARNIAYELGMLPEAYERLWVREEGRVSVHSLLGEGWAEGGIVSAALPLLLLGIFIAAAFKVRGNWAPLVILVSAQGCWDVVFSTWGYNRAMVLAFSAVLAAWAISKSRDEIAQADGLGDSRVSNKPKGGQRRPYSSVLR